MIPWERISSYVALEAVLANLLREENRILVRLGVFLLNFAVVFRILGSLRSYDGDAEENVD